LPGDLAHASKQRPHLKDIRSLQLVTLTDRNDLTVRHHRLLLLAADFLLSARLLLRHRLCYDFKRGLVHSVVINRCTIISFRHFICLDLDLALAYRVNIAELSLLILYHLLLTLAIHFPRC